MVEKWPSLKHIFKNFFLPKLRSKLVKDICKLCHRIDSIGINTCLAPQNDHQHLNFVKCVNVDGKNMARNGCKLAKRKSCQFFYWPVFKGQLISKALFTVFI